MSKWQMRMIIFVLFFILNSFAVAALQAQIDRNQVNLGETFTLIVSKEGRSDADLDTTPLLRYFDIIAQAQTNQVNIVNGVSEARTQWILQLEPKRAGTLVIPPLTLNNETTAAINVKVATQSNQRAPTSVPTTASRNVFIEAKVTPEKPYVQQQVNYKVTLYLADNVANSMQSVVITPPFLNGTPGKQISKYSYFKTERNGVKYQVSQGTFALFPQSSGSQQITPVQFKGEMMVALNNFNSSPLWNTGIKQISASADQITIQVAPKPLQVKDGEWLPAQKLTLRDTWSADTTQIHVGTPITRTVEIQGEGLAPSQLPTLPFVSNDKFNIYSDLPSARSVLGEKGIIGIREQKAAYLPTHAGEITLPAIEIAWWNTTTDRQEIAKLPAKKINVLPALGSTDNVTAAPKPITPTLTSTAHSMSYAWWIAGLFAALWLLTLLGWFWRNRKPQRIVHQSENESTPVTETRGSSLRAACKNNDTRAAQTALFAWATQLWPHRLVRSLGQLATWVQDVELANAIRHLDYVLYANEKKTWDGEIFWQAFQQAQQKKVTQRKKQTEDLLPALHPDDV